MTREEAVARAYELFHLGYNCSQAVYGTFADALGMETELAMRISAPFGGGVGRMRQVCGAVSGMCMVLGLSSDTFDPADPNAKTEIYRQTQALAERFREDNGSIVCSELLKGVSVTSGAKAEERNETYYRKRPCADLVADAAGYAWDMLREKGMV